jgi:16S rRNA (guanine966-N2)-methyltransferase
VRVIAGAKKGIDLRCGRGPHFRPTAQVVKGSIFDTLGVELEGATFLDLFAGSGSVGIEALSRGVKRAIFVEQDSKILKALRTNLERCRFSPAVADVRLGDATRFLERVVKTSAFFDVIYADPPYAGTVAQRVVDAVADARGVLCRVLIVEHGTPVFAKAGGALELAKERHFGQTTVSYFRYRKEAGGGEGKGNTGALSGDV